MALKIRLLAYVLFLILMFSAIACADNLLIGGISQKAMCNPDYQEIAESLDAEYIPTYYGGSIENDIREVRNAALGKGSVQNGLLGLDDSPNKKLKHHYDTIVAYSGGTATAVTALSDYSKYGLTCDTLILISPMAAGVSDGTFAGTIAAVAAAGEVGTIAGGALGTLGGPLSPMTVPVGMVGGGGLAMAGTTYLASIVADLEANKRFENQIETMLKNNPEIKIIVIQSEEDKPTVLSDVYEYTFGKSKTFDKYKDRILIDKAKLTSKGEQAHKDIFFQYATSHLANDGSGGIEFSPTGQCIGPSQSSGYTIDVSQIPGVKFFPAGTVKQETQGSNWLGDNYGFTSWEEEDKMIRNSGGYSRPAPVQGSSGSSRSIQQAIDNMEPVGEYNHYEDTNPIFCQNTCIDGVCGCYDIENRRFV